MSEWSHLPNARHIDRVIQSVKSHPEVWDAAWDETLDEVWDAAQVATWNAVPPRSTLVAVYNAAAAASGCAAREAAVAAWGAILALITYDDAAKYLNMPSDQLKVWAILSEDPAAILLLPAVGAYEKIGELETV